VQGGVAAALVHGACQNDGTCLCGYGFIWQGPLFDETGDIVEVAATAGGATENKQFTDVEYPPLIRAHV